MTAINIIPLRKTTTTATGTTAQNHDYTVPAGKRWLIDYIELEFGTQVAANTAKIQHPAGTDIWDTLSNFLKVGVDLTARFPRAIELEAALVLRIAWVRSGGTTTITSTIYGIERDI